MQSDMQLSPISKGMLRAGWIMSALPALFLLVDGGMKLAKPAIVVQTTVQLGYPESVILGLGIVLLGCTVLYLIPRTSVLGAILLTGYLGGAVATTCASEMPGFRFSSRSSWAHCSGQGLSCASPGCAPSCRCERVRPFPGSLDDNNKESIKDVQQGIQALQKFRLPYVSCLQTGAQT